jgi:hypothetical protein
MGVRQYNVCWVMVIAKTHPKDNHAVDEQECTNEKPHGEHPVMLMMN